MNRATLIGIFLGILLLPPTFAVGDGTTLNYFNVAGHQAFILTPPQSAAGDSATPWVWYAPTRVGATPNASNDWLFQRLLDAGIAIAGIDVGESYGSPAGRATYSQFYDYATNQANLAAKPSLLAQSRGALMLFNWAAENADKVGAIAGIYPVCDLRSFPGLAAAAPAYGITELELSACLAENNPIDRLAPLAQAGIPLFGICGDSDTIAPLAQNSQVVYDRYTALGGQMELVIIPGKGHAEIPEYFENPRLRDFLVTHASAVPEPGSGMLLGGAMLGLAACVWHNWQRARR